MFAANLASEGFHIVHCKPTPVTGEIHRFYLTINDKAAALPSATRPVNTPTGSRRDIR